MARQPEQRLTSTPSGGPVRPSAVDLMTLAEVAAATGRNPELLRRWCAAGRIRCQRIGRDWVIDASDLAGVRAMPRRGEGKMTQIALDDLAALSRSLRAQVEGCLGPGEAVRVVVLGIEGSAIIVTDRKVVVARDGVLVTEPEHGKVAAWPLERIRRVQLDAGASAGALVLTPQDPDDRALVAVLARTHLERAEAATTAIRELLDRAGSYDNRRPGR
jgi:Helix-turn-helix domain